MKNPIDHEKARKRKVLIFSIIMIGLMIFSVAEVIVYNQGGDGQQTEYGDYEFELTQSGDGYVWTTNLNGQQVEFQSLPVQVTYIPVDSDAILLLQQSQQIVLSADPAVTYTDAATVDYARLQLGLALVKVANAISSPSETSSLPVMNCSSATAQQPVVVFNLSNDTSLRRDGFCLVVNGQQIDTLKVKDRIIFEYYGILKNGEVV
jgi:hypothetical protein